MNTVAELEVLSKYLDEEELKEIARKAAYDSFKSSFGEDNSYRKENLEFYKKEAALMAFKDYIDEIKSEENIELFDRRVKSAIKEISWYNISRYYDEIVDRVIVDNKERIENRTLEVLNTLLTEDESSNSVYSKVNDSIGDVFSSIVYEMMKNTFKDEKH